MTLEWSRQLPDPLGQPPGFPPSLCSDSGQLWGVHGLLVQAVGLAEPGASHLYPALTWRFREKALPNRYPVACRTRTLGPSLAAGGGTQGLHGFVGQNLPYDSDLARPCDGEHACP